MAGRHGDPDAGFNIDSILIRTSIVRPGMHVNDVFRECGRAQVQSLPYADAEGRLAGRLTLKNILRVSCLPEYMVQLAPVLGAQLSCVENAESKAHEVLGNPVEPYVQPLPPPIASTAPLIKALAMMQRHDTSYLFVVDDGVYRGILTIQAIASKMSELEIGATV
jgi:hypothetical protein